MKTGALAELKKRFRRSESGWRRSQKTTILGESELQNSIVLSKNAFHDFLMLFNRDQVKVIYHTEEGSGRDGE